MHVALRTAGLLALTLTLSLSAQEAAPDVAAADYGAEAMSQRFKERLQPALEEVLGYTFEAPVSFERVTRDGMAEVLTRENLLYLAEIEGGWRGEELERECKKLGEQFGAMVMAKLDLESGALHVVPENFALIAGISDGWSAVGSQRFLDLILLHEAVHVFQERSIGFATFFEGCTSVGQLKGRMAVVEGHAQYVTRKAAAAAGLEDMFALFLSVSTEVPDSVDDPFERSQLEAVMQNVAFPYTEGEAFFAALVEELGYEAALQRAFAEPPTSLRAVSHPDEYLAPPTQAVDVEALAQRIAKELLGEAFATQVMPLPETALATSFKLAGDEGVAALEHVRSAQVVIGSSREVPGAQVIVAVLELDGAEAGEQALDVERKVSEAKDEQLRQNAQVELEGLDYSDGLPERPGFYVRKDLQAPGVAVTAELAVFQTGALIVEVTRVRLPGGKDATLELTQKVCALIEGE